MTSPVTATSRSAFLAQVDEWRPGAREKARAALDALIEWADARLPAVVPLPADQQATVAFGYPDGRVLWRAYPGKSVENKVVVLPGASSELPAEASQALRAALEAAVPTVVAGADGYLQCPLAPLAAPEVFARFAVFLAAAFAAGDRSWNAAG